VDSSREWYFELGSAPVEDVQAALDEGVAAAQDPADGSSTVLVVDLTDQEDQSVDVRRLMTAEVTGEGFEPDAVELLIRVGPTLAVPIALDVWRRLVLPALERKFGDDAIGPRTRVGEDRHSKHP
jgi:hypothetical protein